MKYYSPDDVILFQYFDLAIRTSTIYVDSHGKVTNVKHRSIPLWKIQPVNQSGDDITKAPTTSMSTPEGRKQRVDELREAYSLCEPKYVSPFDIPGLLSKIDDDGKPHLT